MKAILKTLPSSGINNNIEIRNKKSYRKKTVKEINI